MPLHEVVERLYRDKRLNEFIKKLKPECLQDDLKSHCFLEIYRVAETHPGKIEDLDKKNQLFAWFVGMAKMQLFSTRSTFYRKHRRQFADDTLIDMERPDEQIYFEFHNEDKERDRLIEWAYQQIERPKEQSGKRWLNSTVSQSTPIMMF